MKFLAYIFMCVALVRVSSSQEQMIMPPSPIEGFRQLLKMPVEEQQKILAQRNARSRQTLEKKIGEYNALSQEERDRRLSATELQWYVEMLIRMPVVDRADAIKDVPAYWQPLVMRRLEVWDQLGPVVQKQAMEHKQAIEYLGAPAGRQEAVLRSLNELERRDLTNRIAEVSMLGGKEREALDEFFNMALPKQRQTLGEISETERAQMKVTLDMFRGLSQTQRSACIRSFSKLATMPQAEQIAFLKNAERWRGMSSQERQMWRQIVAVVPPMPEPPTPLPPSPGGF